MGWETRERGGPYYTRSRRVNGKVIREYYGGGYIGQIAAKLDEHKRCQREEEAAYWWEERERLESNAAFLREVEETAEILTKASLLAAGYHTHKGEWRRRHERSA